MSKKFYVRDFQIYDYQDFLNISVEKNLINLLAIY
jgi:hypothetical protein